MPSACIHVFSGTGNSLNAASIIEGRLDSAGWTTKLVRVGCTTEPPSGSFDLHVFAFPVYALDVPEIMLRYLKRLPAGNGAEAVVVATIGKLWAGHSIPGDSGDEGGAVEHVRGILARKGYDVTITDAVPFPANVTLGRLSAGRKEVPGPALRAPSAWSATIPGGTGSARAATGASTPARRVRSRDRHSGP